MNYQESSTLSIENNLEQAIKNLESYLKYAEKDVTGRTFDNYVLGGINMCTNLLKQIEPNS